MPLFTSDEELRLLGKDTAAAVERADAAIRDLLNLVDTIRAEKNAAAIAALQTWALLEQRLTALSAEVDRHQAAAAASERDALRTSGEQEKIELVKEKDEALRKYNELNDQSALRGNSIELERARKILSKREVFIKNWEEKLAGCQSELVARERKLNDVEASLKSKIDKQKKIIRKKLEMLIREKEENKSLLKQIEDLKSSRQAATPPRPPTQVKVMHRRRAEWEHRPPLKFLKTIR